MSIENGNEDYNDALVGEPLPRDRKLSQLVPDHVLRHRHWDVVLAVMDHKPEPCSSREERQYNPGHIRSVKGRTHPMKLGRIVHDRAWVVMAMLFSRACLRLGNATKNGPV